MNVVLGFVAGLGCWLMYSSRRPVALADALDPYSSVDLVGRCRESWPDRVAASRFLRTPASDLAITETDVRRQAIDCLVHGCLGAALPLAMHLVMSLGGVSIPPLLTLVTSLASLFVFARLPRTLVMARARDLRRRFRTSFSAYLDLVSIMLAAGSGPETALVAASRIGSGPTFDLVGHALAVAQSARRSPWEVLAEEGRRIGVDDLPELAATVRLAGEQGARMTASLAAKASSLRDQQMAEIEAAANSATERMGLPLVLMFVSFLVLLGYPAVHLIGQGFTS